MNYMQKKFHTYWILSKHRFLAVHAIATLRLFSRIQSTLEILRFDKESIYI